MATSPAPSLVVPDLRRRGQTQLPVTLRLPTDLVAGLDRQADRLQTTRAGLIRALLVKGVEQLQESAGGRCSTSGLPLGSAAGPPGCFSVPGPVQPVFSLDNGRQGRWY
jgi:hypothetical protein